MDLQARTRRAISCGRFYNCRKKSQLFNLLRV
jgi:hypothetical protein